MLDVRFSWHLSDRGIYLSMLLLSPLIGEHKSPFDFCRILYHERRVPMYVSRTRANTSEGIFCGLYNMVLCDKIKQQY